MTITFSGVLGRIWLPVLLEVSKQHVLLLLVLNHGICTGTVMSTCNSYSVLSMSSTRFVLV